MPIRQRSPRSRVDRGEQVARPAVERAVGVVGQRLGAPKTPSRPSPSSLLTWPPCAVRTGTTTREELVQVVDRLARGGAVGEVREPRMSTNSDRDHRPLAARRRSSHLPSGARSHSETWAGCMRLADDGAQLAAERVRGRPRRAAAPRTPRACAARRSGAGRSGGRRTAWMRRPRRAEQRRHRKRRAGDREVRVLVSGLSTSCSSSTLAEVGAGQRRRQRAVDQRPVDHDVDVVEAVAQDRDAGGERQHHDAGQDRDVRDRLARIRRSRPSCRSATRDHRHGSGPHEPLDLLALQPARAPQPAATSDSGEADAARRSTSSSERGPPPASTQRAVDPERVLDAAESPRAGPASQAAVTKAARRSPAPAHQATRRQRGESRPPVGEQQQEEGRGHEDPRDPGERSRTRAAASPSPVAGRVAVEPVVRVRVGQRRRARAEHRRSRRRSSRSRCPGGARRRGRPTPRRRRGTRPRRGSCPGSRRMPASVARPMPVGEAAAPPTAARRERQRGRRCASLTAAPPAATATRAPAACVSRHDAPQLGAERVELDLVAQAAPKRLERPRAS